MVAWTPLRLAQATLLLISLSTVHADKCVNSTLGPLCVASLVRDLLNVSSGNAASNGTDVGLRPSVTTAVGLYLQQCLNVSSQPLRPLRLLILDQARGRGAEVLAGLLQQQLGLQVNMTFVDIPLLTSTVVADLTSNPIFTAPVSTTTAPASAPPPPALPSPSSPAPLPYDGWVIDPSSVVDLAALGALAPLEGMVREDGDLQWSDVMPFFRQVATIYDGHLIGIPFTGQVSVLYYRKDVLDAASLPVPATWEELLFVATALNGSDYNGDGVGDYAICWQVVDCLEDTVVLSQIVAPYIQAMGTASGWLFDPHDLALLLNSTALHHAMDLMRRLQALVAPGPRCDLITLPFVTGQCALTIKWTELFKVSAIYVPALRGRVGVAPLPGAARVLDRASGRLLACTNTTCPHATPHTDLLTGQPVLVNRAPHFGFGSFSGAARRDADPDYQRAVYRYFANLASVEMSWEFVLDPVSGVGPFRLSHVDPANINRWAAAGYDANDTLGFLAALHTSIGSPNVALDIRILNSFKYRSVLAEAVANLTTRPEVPVAEVFEATVAGFARVLVESGDRAEVMRTYRSALGYAAPAPPSPPNGPAAPLRRGGSRVLAASLAPSGLAMALLLCLVACATYNWSRGRSPLGAPLPPRPGHDTTLLLAALPDLARLQREAPREELDRALSLYLSLMRRLLRRHRGYEGVAAERAQEEEEGQEEEGGDVKEQRAASHPGLSQGANHVTSSVVGAPGSLAHAGGCDADMPAAGDPWVMVAAFRSPSDALRFAVAAQGALLRADWPPALLAHGACRPVYAVPAASLLQACDSDPPLGVSTAFHASPGRQGQAGAGSGTDGDGEEETGGVQKVRHCGSAGGSSPEGREAGPLSPQRPVTAPGFRPEYGARVATGSGAAARGLLGRRRLLSLFGPPASSIATGSRASSQAELGEGAASVADEAGAHRQSVPEAHHTSTWVPVVEMTRAALRPHSSPAAGTPQPAMTATGASAAAGGAFADSTPAVHGGAETNPTVAAAVGAEQGTERAVAHREPTRPGHGQRAATADAPVGSPFLSTSPLGSTSTTATASTAASPIAASAAHRHAAGAPTDGLFLASGAASWVTELADPLEGTVASLGSSGGAGPLAAAAAATSRPGSAARIPALAVARARAGASVLALSRRLLLASFTRGSGGPALATSGASSRGAGAASGSAQGLEPQQGSDGGAGHAPLPQQLYPRITPLRQHSRLGSTLQDAGSTVAPSPHRYASSVSGQSVGDLEDEEPGTAPANASGGASSGPAPGAGGCFARIPLLPSPGPAAAPPAAASTPPLAGVQGSGAGAAKERGVDGTVEGGAACRAPHSRPEAALQVVRMSQYYRAMYVLTDGSGRGLEPYRPPDASSGRGGGGGSAAARRSKHRQHSALGTGWGATAGAAGEPSQDAGGPPPRQARMSLGEAVQGVGPRGAALAVAPRSYSYSQQHAGVAGPRTPVGSPGAGPAAAVAGAASRAPAGHGVGGHGAGGAAAATPASPGLPGARRGSSTGPAAGWSAGLLRGAARRHSAGPELLAPTEARAHALLASPVPAARENSRVSFRRSSLSSLGSRGSVFGFVWGGERRMGQGQAGGPAAALPDPGRAKAPSGARQAGAASMAAVSAWLLPWRRWLQKAGPQPASSAAGGSEAEREEEPLAMQLGGVLVQRGLRVCMGLHSGIPSRHASYCRTSRRMLYGGPGLGMAAALSHAAGSMACRVLLSGAAFGRLGGWVADTAATATVLNVGEFDMRAAYGVRRPVSLYMPLPPSLGPALAAHRHPRLCRQLAGGVLEAPVGDVTVAFANVVGAGALLAWDLIEARAALSVLSRAVCDGLSASSGYLVELSEGLALATWPRPHAAVAWGLGLMARLLAHDGWSRALLAHELCEEVRVPAPGGGGGMRLLYRGLRLKIGIDTGALKAGVSAVTGRVAYRGRAMNRAARIAAKAPAGQLWCSGEVWRWCRLAGAAGSDPASPATPRTASGAFPPAAGRAGPARLQHSPLAQQQPPRHPAPPPSPGMFREGAAPRLAAELFAFQPALPAASPERWQPSSPGPAGAPQGRLRARYMGRHVLKGVAEPLDLWQCGFDTTPCGGPLVGGCWSPPPARAEPGYQTTAGGSSPAAAAVSVAAAAGMLPHYTAHAALSPPQQRPAPPLAPGEVAATTGLVVDGARIFDGEWSDHGTAAATAPAAFCTGSSASPSTSPCSSPSPAKLLPPRLMLGPAASANAAAPASRAAAPASRLRHSTALGRAASSAQLRTHAAESTADTISAPLPHDAIASESEELLLPLPLDMPRLGALQASWLDADAGVRAVPAWGGSEGPSGPNSAAAALAATAEGLDPPSDGVGSQGRRGLGRSGIQEAAGCGWEGLGSDGVITMPTLAGAAGSGVAAATEALPAACTRVSPARRPEPNGAAGAAAGLEAAQLDAAAGAIAAAATGGDAAFSFLLGSACISPARVSSPRPYASPPSSTAAPTPAAAAAAGALKVSCPTAAQPVASVLPSDWLPLPLSPVAAAAGRVDRPFALAPGGQEWGAANAMAGRDALGLDPEDFGALAAPRRNGGGSPHRRYAPGQLVLPGGPSQRAHGVHGRGRLAECGALPCDASAPGTHAVPSHLAAAPGVGALGAAGAAPAGPSPSLPLLSIPAYPVSITFRLPSPIHLANPSGAHGSHIVHSNSGHVDDGGSLLLSSSQLRELEGSGLEHLGGPGAALTAASRKASGVFSL